MIRLTLHLSGRPVQSFNFEQDLVQIGRDPDCDVPIENIGISREHATIEQEDGEYVLNDLRSHNGTFVQGRRIYTHKLLENDEFFIGKYGLTFENLDVAVAAPTTPKSSGAALQDMTFRLDRSEIDRLMGSSGLARSPKLLQLAPARHVHSIALERHYYLIGKDTRANLWIGGWFTPPFAAALIRNDKWFHLVALTRKTKVRVNGLDVKDHQLSDGDVIEVGRSRFRFARS